MKSKIAMALPWIKTIPIFGLVLVIMTIPSFLNSQIVLSKGVVGSGGGHVVDEDVQLSSTFGQVVIGRGPTDELIYEFGFWYGIQNDFSTSTEELSISDINESIELNISPNPANTSTELAYRLSEKSFVNIEIASITGHVVRNIYRGTKVAGDHSLQIDTQGIPTGIYICKLSSEIGNQTIKMIVI